MEARNIKLGDKLNSKTLTLDFSELTYEMVGEIIGVDDYINLITTNAEHEEVEVGIVLSNYGDGNCDIRLNTTDTVLFEIENYNVTTSLTSIDLPSDFGIVIHINENTAYACIKVSGLHDKVYAICENMCLEETLTTYGIEGKIYEVMLPQLDYLIESMNYIRGSIDEISNIKMLNIYESFTIPKNVAVKIHNIVLDDYTNDYFEENNLKYDVNQLNVLSCKILIGDSGVGGVDYKNSNLDFGVDISYNHLDNYLVIKIDHNNPAGFNENTTIGVKMICYATGYMDRN